MNNQKKIKFFNRSYGTECGDFVAIPGQWEATFSSTKHEYFKYTASLGRVSPKTYFLNVNIIVSNFNHNYISIGSLGFKGKMTSAAQLVEQLVSQFEANPVYMRKILSKTIYSADRYTAHVWSNNFGYTPFVCGFGGNESRLLEVRHFTKVLILYEDEKISPLAIEHSGSSTITTCASAELIKFILKIK